MRIFQPQRLVALRSYTGEKGRTQLEKNTFIWARLFFSILYTDERERKKLLIEEKYLQIFQQPSSLASLVNN